jgi:serine/threonine protein kinase/formylglycine-generating enzyme required for sulfatase activity
MHRDHVGGTDPACPPEIDAFVRERHLPPSDRDHLAALFERLASARGWPAPAAATVELPSARTTAEATPEARGRMPTRYDDLGMMGAGGMGEVRRVRDRELGRTCAYKVIKPDLQSKPSVVARFVEEAEVAAQLQHPNIPPVYDAGRLPDGRPWFTMKEVRGQTLNDLIREVHAAGVSDAAFRRLGDVFAKVCDGVGYAHERGVVHRDLKPENVMVGAHGEVLVLDWGLAKVVGRPDRALDEGDLEPEVASTRSADESQKTRMGGVLGTAAYMPPEQARGEVDRLDARSDVYGLGAMLYEILSGRPPYEGRDARAVLRQVLAGPPDPPRRATGSAGGATFTFGVEELESEVESLALPAELVALCERCMAREPSERPPDGAAVAVAARAWLDGAKKRENALLVVTAAEAVVAEMASLRERATTLRAEGDALLAAVEPWEPEEAKAAGWARQDAAERAEREASLLELKREALLQGALTHAPELPEAHAALAELELSRHQSAERSREERQGAQAELRLRDHVDALPEGHEVRRRAAAYLKGDGALTLITEPEAEVALYRYVAQNRRLVAVGAGSLGRTPVRERSLPMGSYLCVLRHPDRAEVRYPVHIGRGEHWDGVPPGEREPRPVRLPRRAELGPDDCLVPAGWFWSGGDPDAVDGLPRRRLWCDGLVVRRFPVTNREYLAFLDALVADGREAEAVRHQPRERAAEEGVAVYGRDAAGRFVLRPDADGDVWDADWPVLLVDWFGASAYAAWLAERTGQPWRLLAELEWEKVARGVDGRFFPWGDRFDASWTCTRLGHQGRPRPAVVDSHPVDSSVYGVRGLAGNVLDWCADEFRLDGSVQDGEVVSWSRADPADVATVRVRRGGHWNGTIQGARAATRSRDKPGFRDERLGFRLGRSLRGDEPLP